MVLEIFGTLIRSVWLLLKGHSQLSGIIHSAEHEEWVSLSSFDAVAMKCLLK